MPFSADECLPFGQGAGLARASFGTPAQSLPPGHLQLCFRTFPLRSGFFVSLLAHALLLLAVLCAEGQEQPQGLDAVITLELADLSGLPGRGDAARSAAGSAGGAPKTPAGRQSRIQTAAAPAPVKDPAVNIRDKTSRQTPPQEQDKAANKPGPSAVPVGAASEANASDASDGGLGQQAGRGTGSGAGGVPGGVAGAAGTGGGGGAVDHLPRIIEKVKPAYPEHARRRHKTGVVTLKFLVDAEGRVHHPSVIEANPPGYFEESALTAIARWRFAPALRQGRPVPTWLILPVRFSLESGE